jgi:hypothetical protein
MLKLVLDLTESKILLYLVFAIRLTMDVSGESYSVLIT